ncbi:entericidin A/B family lipoprotein [Emcibacter sp.]
MFSKLKFTAVIAAFLFGTAACSTVEGLGKDIESVGEGTQDVAN